MRDGCVKIFKICFSNVVMCIITHANIVFFFNRRNGTVKLIT